MHIIEYYCQYGTKWTSRFTKILKHYGNVTILLGGVYLMGNANFKRKTRRQCSLRIFYSLKLLLLYDLLMSKLHLPLNANIPFKRSQATKIIILVKVTTAFY